MTRTLPITLPLMTPIKQDFHVPALGDTRAHARRIIRDSGLLEKITPGQQVAVGVGSRGIADLTTVVATLCQLIKERNAVPFLFPAMGSHGGATSTGQAEVLRALGIDETTVGAEIRSNADAAHIGETPDGIPVYVDRHALDADHVVVVNRIKPHTKFKGPIESGIAKMLSIGIGKVAGATALHQKAVKFGFPHVIRSTAQKIIEAVPFLFALALIETPDKKIHDLSILTPGTLDREEILLKKASEVMPRIPFEEIDLLIVDEIGKDISGTGMDTNVTGRNRDITGTFSINPRVARILVRDLSAKTGGNANGIGLADFTTRRLVDKIDQKKTYTNALSAMSPEKAAIPVTLDNDRDAIVAALQSIGLTDATNATVLRIKNTSELTHMQVSTALAAQIPEMKSRGPEITGPAAPMAFDADGNLNEI